jgi:hypothetical protein
MKRIALFFLMILLVALSTVAYSQQHQTMLLLPKAGAADTSLLYLSRGMNDIFLTDVINEMEKNYPCIGVTDPKAASLSMAELRLQGTAAFGSRDVGPVISRIAGSMANPDLAVRYCMFVNSGESVTASVTCANSDGEIIAEFSESFPVTQAMQEGKSIPPVRRLVEELKKHEICPYTGSVMIETESEREESSSTSTACDAGSVVTDVEINSNSTLKWDLMKEGLARASGNVTYDLKEKIKIVIKNPCYICQDGTKGFATTTETNEKEAKVQGLSNESVSEGAQTADARIRLTFLDNRTYLLTVKATSDKGPMKITTEKKVDGPCLTDNESEPPDTKTKSIDVPFTVVFGPYQGTPTDKVLSQSEEKDLSTGKEKVTLKIDFTLTRQ